MPMILKDKIGYTLPEMLVTIFVSTIAVGLILGTYSIVIRVWNRYNFKMEAMDNAWLCYGKVDKMFSKIDRMEQVSDNNWIAYKNVVKAYELVYQDKILALKDSTVKWRTNIDSFSLEKADENGSIWHCSITCRKGKEKAGIAWRAICNRLWDDALLPEILP